MPIWFHKNRKIWMRYAAGILIIALSIPFDSNDLLNQFFRASGAVDVQYFWMNSILYSGMYGYYFAGMAAALPYADNFCIEYQTGIWKYLIARSTLKRYFFGKICRCFLTGAFTTFSGGLLFLVTAARQMPLFQMSRYEEIVFLPYAELLKDNAKLYFLTVLVLFSLSGGLLASISYTFSVFYPVRYVVYLTPFIASFLLSRLNAVIHMPDEWRVDYWLRARSSLIPSGSGLFPAVLGVVLLVGISSMAAYKKARWRLENE